MQCYLQYIFKKLAISDHMIKIIEDINSLIPSHILIIIIILFVLLFFSDIPRKFPKVKFLKRNARKNNNIIHVFYYDSFGFDSYYISIFFIFAKRAITSCFPISSQTKPIGQIFATSIVNQ